MNYIEDQGVMHAVFYSVMQLICYDDTVYCDNVKINTEFTIHIAKLHTN